MADEDDGYDSKGMAIAMSMYPRPSALFSIIGSYALAREVVVDHRKKQGKPISRVLLLLSLCDIIYSFAWLLTTLPAPKELNNLWGNVGNIATCTAQGAFLQFGLMSSLLFNTELATFYLLIVKWQWSDAKLVRLEKWAHSAIFLFSLACAVVPIPLDLYNSSWEVCWIDSFPPDCMDEDELSCTRGQDAWIWGLAFTSVVWACFLASSIAFGMIFAAVRAVENKSLKYAGTLKGSSKSRSRDHDGSPPSGNTNVLDQRRNHSVNRQKSRAVAKQALFYLGAFFVVYSLDLVASVIYYSTGSISIALDSCAYMLKPLQGALNFAVFARTRPDMKTPEGRLLRRLICACRCCCGCCCQERNVTNDASSHCCSRYCHRKGSQAQERNSATETG